MKIDYKYGCWTISRFKLRVFPPALGWSGAQLALGQVASPGRLGRRITENMMTFSALFGSVLSLFSYLGDLGCGWYHLFQSLLHFDFLILQLAVHLLAGLRNKASAKISKKHVHIPKAHAHSKGCMRSACQAIAIAGGPGWAHCYRASVGWCRQTWSALKSLRKGHSSGGAGQEGFEATWDSILAWAMRASSHVYQDMPERSVWSVWFAGGKTKKEGGSGTSVLDFPGR